MPLSPVTQPLLIMRKGFLVVSGAVKMHDPLGAGEPPETLDPTQCRLLRSSIADGDATLGDG